MPTRARWRSALIAFQRLFVGKKYVLSPLGEGEDGDRDADPLYDFDRFDCVTLTEEVMALSWRADLDDAINRLQDVRYTGGEVDYGKRKHITMAQWIPQNLKAGFVTDVTHRVGGKRDAASSADAGARRLHFEEGARAQTEETRAGRWAHSRFRW